MIHTQYGCIGKKLTHSFSKIIHEKIGDYSYELLELAEDELEPFFALRNFKAINVTIPYKQAVIPYLDEISETARAIGAVNTIVNSKGKLIGYNTDFYGMTALIKKNGISLKNKKVTILGTGGTSKTSFAVAEALGAKEILTVSRTAQENNISYECLNNNHSDTDIIINTTPVGMYPDIFASPIEIERFKHLSGVIDAVYNPLTTVLVSEAKKLKIPADCGLFMLTAQAVKANEIFTGIKADPDLADKIYSEILFEKQNIVLTGMPGSGKSTTGKILAEKFGRKFIDTDKEIEKETCVEIKAFFEKFGEEKFREIETMIIKKISSESGAVIATGGGAILKAENVEALKMNGVLYFIDRPLKDLIPTSDRPLASSVEEIEKRYSERYVTYTATADEMISVEGSCNDVANEIERKHFK